MQRDNSNFSPGQMATAALTHETFLIKVRLDMQLILPTTPTSAETNPDFAALLHLLYRVQVSTSCKTLRLLDTSNLQPYKHHIVQVDIAVVWLNVTRPNRLVPRFCRTLCLLARVSPRPHHDVGRHIFGYLNGRMLSTILSPFSAIFIHELEVYLRYIRSCSSSIRSTSCHRYSQHPRDGTSSNGVI